ncbi:MAG: hypothetical protein E7262_08875 [Lachnospiraceae bacterium]|nr:hypothetical protein [Lachnospiraceae bacterium]
MDDNTLSFIIFIGAGILFMILSIILTISRKRKEKLYTLRTTATVVDIEVSISNFESSMGPVHKPVFEYYVNGKSFKDTYFIGTNPPTYKKDDRVELLLNSNDPSKYIIADAKANKRIERYFFIFGLCFTIISVIMYNYWPK